MISFLKKLSPKVEFLIVLSLAFGFISLSNLLNFLSSATQHTLNNDVLITDSDLIFIVVYELVLLLIVGCFLFLRGWTLEKLGMKSWPRLSDVWHALVLTFIVYIVYFIVFSVFSSMLYVGNASSSPIVTTNVGLPLVIVLSVINPFFEEIFVGAYILQALKGKRSLLFAVNLSVIIRFSYHLYQGEMAIISIIPLGLLFAYFFLKYQNLWPLILSHGLLDFVGLMALNSQEISP